MRGADAGFVDAGEGFGELGKALGDVLAIAGVDGDSAGLGGVAAVDLRAHAVVFVFEEGLDGGAVVNEHRSRVRRRICVFGRVGLCRRDEIGRCGVRELLRVTGCGCGWFGCDLGWCGLTLLPARLLCRFDGRGFGRLCGEALDGLFGSLDGAGQHEAERVEEAHARRAECSLEGPVDGKGEIGLEHDGVAYGLDGDGCGGVRRCDRDRFFDEALFYADAHVAEHELEQVLGFERGRAAEEALDERGADRGGLRDGHGGEGFGDFGEGEGWG